MPGEFRELAEAMNGTADSLARVVAVAQHHGRRRFQLGPRPRERDGADLGVRDANGVVDDRGFQRRRKSGAPTQVGRRGVAFHSLECRRNACRSGEVTNLAGAIGDSAKARRTEIERALGILQSVRTRVQDAARKSSPSIARRRHNRFVATVSRIAEQTDLLALNAHRSGARRQCGTRLCGGGRRSSQAVRTGPAGRGRRVQLTQVVTARVSSTTRAMEAGVANVKEIETVSRNIDSALDAITSAAERTRTAWRRGHASRAETPHRGNGG